MLCGRIARRLSINLYRCQSLKNDTGRPWKARPTTACCWKKRSVATAATGRTGYVGSNQQQREELAAAYQATEYLGLSEGINNHLSTRAPARSGRGEVTASRLVGVDLESGNVIEGSGQPEKTAIQIHCQVHREAIKNGSPLNSVFHLHPPYCSALACLEDPTLRMIHQNSARFLDNIAYDDGYDGLANTSDEGARIARVMDGKSALLMGNHGVLVTGETVACAFNSTYYLERAAMVQILAMSSGAKLRELDYETSNLVREQIMVDYTEVSATYFDAIKRAIKTNSSHDFTE